MAELKALICTKCGGRINRGTMECMYCGTQYKLDDQEVLHIARFDPKMDVLGCTVTLGSELMDIMGETEFCEVALKTLAEKMARQMLPLTTIRWSMDPLHRQVHLQGKIRAIRPDERFDDARQMFYEDVRRGC